MTAEVIIPSSKHKIDFLLSPLTQEIPTSKETSPISSVSTLSPPLQVSSLPQNGKLLCSKDTTEEDKSNAVALLMLQNPQEKKDVPFVFRKKNTPLSFSAITKQDSTAGHIGHNPMMQEDSVDTWIVALRAQTYCYVLNEASTDDEKRYRCLFDASCNKKIKGKGNLRRHMEWHLKRTEEDWKRNYCWFNPVNSVVKPDISKQLQFHNITEHSKVLKNKLQESYKKKEPKMFAQEKKLSFIQYKPVLDEQTSLIAFQEKIIT